MYIFCWICWAGTWYYLWILFHFTVFKWNVRVANASFLATTSNVCFLHFFIVSNSKKKKKNKNKIIGHLWTKFGRRTSTIACSSLVNTTKTEKNKITKNEFIYSHCPALATYISYQSYFELFTSSHTVSLISFVSVSSCRIGHVPEPHRKLNEPNRILSKCSQRIKSTKTDIESSVKRKQRRKKRCRRKNEIISN